MGDAEDAPVSRFEGLGTARREKLGGLPFALIARPEELFDDPQLNQTGNKGLLPTTLPDGIRTRLPRLPLEMGQHDFALRHDPPAIGADTGALLAELGYCTAEIERLKDAGTIA